MQGGSLNEIQRVLTRVIGSNALVLESDLDSRF